MCFGPDPGASLVERMSSPRHVPAIFPSDVMNMSSSAGMAANLVVVIVCPLGLYDVKCSPHAWYLSRHAWIGHMTQTSCIGERLVVWIINHKL